MIFGAETSHLNENASSKKLSDLACYLCGSETKGTINADDHASKTHKVVECLKCSHAAVDKSLLGKHMVKHTRGILFNCHICEVEATRKFLQDNHMVAKHIKNPGECPKCESCGKTFPLVILSRYHNSSLNTLILALSVNLWLWI